MYKQMIFSVIASCVLTSCKKSNNDAEIWHLEPDTLSAEKVSNQPPDTLENKVILFKCKENDNGKSRYDDSLNKTCACKEKTFEKAYKIFYDESPSYLKENLLEKLPKGDFQFKSNSANVSYKRILSDTLKIDIAYDGGDVTYVFYQNKDSVIEYKEYLGLP